MFKKAKKAFTLLELIVVIVILGILAALAIPTFASVLERTNANVALTELQAVAREASAIAAFDGEGSMQYSLEQFLETGAPSMASGGVYAADTGSVRSIAWLRPGGTTPYETKADVVLSGNTLDQVSRANGYFSLSYSADAEGAIGLAMRTSDQKNCVFVAYENGALQDTMVEEYSVDGDYACRGTVALAELAPGVDNGTGGGSVDDEGTSTDPSGGNDQGTLPETGGNDGGGGGGEIPNGPASEVDNTTPNISMVGDASYGRATDIHGEWAVVGEPGLDDNATPGNVYVYHDNGDGTWPETNKFTGDLSARFGFSVAFNGARAYPTDTLVVGNPSLWNDEQSRIQIYGLTGESWSETQTILDPEYDGSNSQFGFDVDAAGDVIAVGANNWSGSGPGSGKVYMYTKQGGQWELATTITAPVDNFGTSVDLDYRGNLVVGGKGQVLFYERSGNDWTSNGGFTGSGNYGLSSVDTDGGRTVVADTTNGTIYVYSRVGDEGPWSPLQEINFGANGLYGSSYDDNKLMVTVRYDSDGNSGASLEQWNTNDGGFYKFKSFNAVKNHLHNIAGIKSLTTLETKVITASEINGKRGAYIINLISAS